MKKRNAIVLLVVLLAIGFAAVTTTLVINGNILFGTNDDDFDVYFSKAVIDEVEDNSVISQDGKTITYETKNLEVVGDTSLLEYTVTNNSRNYDAEVVMSCELADNEYVRIDNTLQNEIIEAKSERVGILTVTLIKTSVNETTMEVRCTIDASAAERETLGSDPLIEGTYSMYGTLTDDMGTPITNTVIAVFSNPQYTTTDDNGYFYIGGLETGSHTLYILDELTIENVKELKKSEVEEQAITKAKFTTNTVNIVFENGYLLEEEVVELTRTYAITLDSNGGEVENNVIEVTIGDYYPEELVPTYQDEGFIFTGWYIDIYQGTKIELSGIVGELEVTTLYARWTCQNGDVCVVSGTGSSIGDMLQIGNERFYVTNNDGINAKMLSEFNLYVGNECTSNNSSYCSKYENPTGIQNSMMKGYVSGQTIRRGTIAFSSDEKKGTNYNSYSGSIVQGYVNAYGDYLKNSLEVENSSTLITESELGSLGCSSSVTCKTTFEWVCGTSYWTRTVSSTDALLRLASDCGWGTTYYYDEYRFGVRPLVTISTSYI